MTDEQQRILLIATDQLDQLCNQLREVTDYGDRRIRSKLLGVVTDLHEVIGSAIYNKERGDSK